RTSGSGGRFNGCETSRRRGGPGSLLTLNPYTGLEHQEQLDQVDQLPFAFQVSDVARHPPANGGSSSMTAPSPSTFESLSALPTGSALTRNDDLASTAASRLSRGLLATAASRASRRVTASRDSSAIPAASFAAAQYLMVILTMCDILISTGPRA